MKTRTYLTTAIALVALAASAFAADNEVTGSFTGNGQEAKLAHISARKSGELSGKETVAIVMTEKDHSTDKRPEIGAGFGKYGSALIVTIHPDDGNVVGTEVAHDAHGKKPFSSSGALTMSDYKNEGGVLSGKVTTGKEREFFGAKWAVDLTFKVKAP
jgi:hypothetical protein